MKLTESSQNAWYNFLANQDNYGHADRKLQAQDINSHVQTCWHSALSTANRIRSDLNNFEPRRILEIGSSTGLNCFALQTIYPHTEIIGIEPEHEAVVTAHSMTTQSNKRAPIFSQGYGEKLSIEDASVDLIICHTVIEHVQDVEKVIQEMARVLAPGGYVHLEAPNYFWPYEPHLRIWCLPLLGKASVNFMGKLQGQKRNLNFLNHLQFVTPWRLEKCFKQNGLDWNNRVKQKLVNSLQGNTSQVKAYKRIAMMLRLIKKIGLEQLLIKIVMRAAFYPSVLYTLHKPNNG
ncbi:MAG: class I SAM-dependent methyltransferase [Pseudomonadota bacterium]